MKGRNPTTYGNLPEHMQQSARDYVERGILSGGFLSAVLENNLVLACSYADTINQHHLRTWAEWLWNEAPTAC
jgi:hypothetical protein